MENLIEVLDKESREYENLLGLSMRKTPVIVSGNLEELAKITEEEQIVVSKITNLDHKRQELFADIANVINRDVNKLMLADLVAILAQRPQEQQKLAKLQGYIDKILTKREKEIITLRYGLRDGCEVTQREIADKLNISRSYVSRIEKKALNKLKAAYM